MYINETFFCRIGSKQDIVDKLISMVPEHKIYVEPFVGGGSMFWKMDNKSKMIINDIDKQLIEGYRLLKKNDDNKLIIPPTIEEKQQLVNRKARDDNERLTQILLLSCNTFGSQGKYKIYKNTAHIQKIKKINEYSNKLKNTTILNQDFKKVIKKYDSKDTFFFLDPPYEKSIDTLYDNYFIDYKELVSILSNIKGFFMLTINDSPNIRNLFKKFNIVQIVVKQKSNSELGGSGDRRELIIMNYEF